MKMKNESLKTLSNLAIFNKGTGTVTIPYDAYILMHKDSIFLNFIRCSYKQGRDEDVVAQVHTILEDPVVGTGFTKAQPPMCDSEAIAYLYGLPEDYVSKYILEREAEEC